MYTSRMGTLQVTYEFCLPQRADRIHNQKPSTASNYKLLKNIIDNNLIAKSLFKTF